MIYKKRELTEEAKIQLDKKNKKIFSKVSVWQAFKYIKPLSCQKIVDERKGKVCGAVLSPRITKYKVVLDCPKCKHCQAYVPKKVLEANLTVPKALTDNKGKNINALDVLTNKLQNAKDKNKQ